MVPNISERLATLLGNLAESITFEEMKFQRLLLFL
jgi:hypothetical protein